MTSCIIQGVPFMDVESAESFERVGGGTRMRWVWEVARMLGRRLDRMFANIKRVLDA